MSHSKKKKDDDRLDEIKSSITSLEQRVEELMELQRQGNGLEEYSRPDTLPGFPQYSPGSVMVGVPKFFDYNHLAQVDRTYSNIKDHWMRGRLTAWNAQMRFAQLANDIEATCLFMMLQLEALAQLLLTPLYIKEGVARRDFTLPRVSGPAGDGSTRSLSLSKGESVDVVPHMGFGLRTAVTDADGIYVKVESNKLKNGDSVMFRSLEENDFGEHYASYLGVSAYGVTREVHIMHYGELLDVAEFSNFTMVLTAPVPWAQIDWLKGCWLWVSRESLAEYRGDIIPLDRKRPSSGTYFPAGQITGYPTDETLRGFEKKYWKLILPAPQGLDVVSSGWKKFPFKARYKVPSMPEGANEFMLYADKERVLLDGSAAPLEVMLRFDYSGEDPVLKTEAGAISVIAGRVSRQRGGLHDVLGQFGQSTSSIAERLSLLMQVSPEGMNAIDWQSRGASFNTFHVIKNMRNNLVHGNLGQLKSGAPSISMDDVASFWDCEIVPRLSHWIHEANN